MAWAALRLPRFFRGAGRRALFPTYTDLPAPPEGGGTDSFGIISVLFREDLNRRFGQQANWQLYKKDKDNDQELEARRRRCLMIIHFLQSYTI